MKTFVSVVLFCWALTLQAEVVIYKIAKTTTWIGNGTTVFETVTGRMVFDPQAADTARIITWLPQSRFQLDCPQLDVKYVRGPRRSNQAAFFLKGDGYDAETLLHESTTQAYLRGTNANVLIGPDSRLVLPKILRGTWQASFESATDENFIGQATGVIASYMGNETIAANANLQTVDDVINGIVDTYVGRGWAEVSGEAPCEFVEMAKARRAALHSK